MKGFDKDMLVPRIQHLIDLMQLELDAFGRMTEETNDIPKRSYKKRNIPSWQSKLNPAQKQAWLAKVAAGRKRAKARRAAE